MGRLGRELLFNPDLERAIAEAPYDEERWSILEDWLLENEDPRALLIRHAHAGNLDAATRARVRLHRQLLGPKHQSLAPLLYRADWRAGYLREVNYAANDVKALATLAQAPAARILRTLTLTIPKQDVRPALAAVANGVFVDALHDLTVSNVHAAPLLVPAPALGPLTRLRRLALRGSYIEETARVERITRLAVAPTSYDIAQLGLFATNVRFPAVADFLLDLSNIAEPKMTDATLGALLDAQFAPLVTHVEIRGATRKIARSALRILAESPLLRQLQVVDLGPTAGSKPGFEHVRVTVPS